MKNEQKSIDNTYGGVRYRSSYDDSRRAAAIRILRRSRRGARSFKAAVGAVSLFCLLTVGFAVVYRIADVAPADRNGEDNARDEAAVAVNAQVCTDRSKDYGGHFRISEMNNRAHEAYHMPSGIMVSEVYEGDTQENGGLIEEGDIITAVNGVKTPDVDTFHSQFASEGVKTVEFSIYRKGKHISLCYTIDED
ncbi:MAG: PDZ domain-containing protein [Clostridia bacterium]|nr:PDZ domain-containing protein [Clostridia bacterium]